MTLMLTIAIIALCVLLGAGYYFSSQVIHIRTYGDDDIFLYEKNAGTVQREEIEMMPKEELEIPSAFGYSLRGWLFSAEQDQGKVVILVHGVTSSLIGCLKYMHLFRKRGFHVLAYDQRRHGKSGGASTSYGYYEKQDLKTVVDWLHSRYGSSCKIGIFGESMGAATALQHAAIDSRASFYVVDCPYSDLKEELKYRLKIDYRMPAFPFLPLTGLFAWMRGGFRFGSVSPLRDISKVKTPVLFIHGDEDRYIPKEMTVALYLAKPGPKRLLLMTGADHAQSIRVNGEEYDRVVGAFLDELGLGGNEQADKQVAAADRAGSYEADPGMVEAPPADAVPSLL